MCNEPRIVKDNKDIEHILFAACGYGIYEVFKIKDKNFSMLVTTDIHECKQQTGAAIDYLNYYDAIDCGICLGDVQSSNIIGDGDWYYEAIKHTKKPFMTIIGNHDVGNSKDPAVSGSSKEFFDKFISPTASLSGIEDFNEPHFLKLFDEYKVALIGLDIFGETSPLDQEGKYIVPRGAGNISQNEINWFIDSLSKIPSDYHLIVALHMFFDKDEAIDSPWCQKGSNLACGNGAYGGNDMIPDIVDAWVNGKALKGEYPSNYDCLPTLIVDCDFSSRGEGIFASYIVGHYHRDILSKSKKYSYQKIIAFPATANDRLQNYCSDLPRVPGTRTEDAITVMSLETKKRQIRLVRVGSNMSINMDDRRYLVLDY